ncbi:MAG: ATP-dependent zinc metalloprotease FtsH [Candidatus Latescibacterota bacterium]|nr:ATP-dependent zinc metalloprotease FtsH [Candidatus Latescibacterota bacterium]
MYEGKQTDREDDRSKRWRRPSRTSAFWIFFVLVLIFAAKFFNSTPSDAPTISYIDYREYLEDGEIAEAVVVGENEFHGTLNNGERFVVNLGPIDAETKREWRSYKLIFRFKEEPFRWYDVLFSILPWILFVAIWIFMLRQMQGGSRGLFSFGKSRAKLRSQDEQQTTFADVAGADEAKEELQEVIDFLRDPQKFQRLGGRIPKGVLMVGPPGTGKTHLARAVAGEAGVPFFSISGSDFVEMFVGVGASRVRDLFEQAKTSAPCLIFVDEIDAVGRHRGAGVGGGHDEREQTLNQLLVEMDGFESNDGVILVAATNRPDVLDPALLRPGRFDRRVVVDLPDVRGREGILKVHARMVPLNEAIDLKKIAQGTPGLSGADLANLVNEAALLASRRDHSDVKRSDFEDAKDKVMLGAERRSMILTQEDRRLSAYHEAGHALVAKLAPGAHQIGKATIIPRGQAMGMVSFLPDERRSVTETRLKAHLATALGGCCAERIIFDERSTGAQGDYKQVAALARSMVCEWGMNEKLGPLSLGDSDEEVFLGKGFARSSQVSEETAQAIDQEIRRIVQEAETTATRILEENGDELHALAQALLDYEVLDDAELDKILAGQPLEREPIPSVSERGISSEDEK